MSLSSIMSIGVSGLMTAQDQLRTTSDNISNVNTPGYIRKVSAQTSVVADGKGLGVQSGQVTLAANKYLQAAMLKAASSAGQSGVSNELLDSLQGQFGDLVDSNSIFNQAATTLTSFATLGEDPTSSASRQQALSNLSSFLSEGSRISGAIQDVRTDADGRIASDISSINDLLKNISSLNAAISSATAVGGDATGAQTTQSGYIDQLSKLMDVKVTQNSNGGLTVRTSSGVLLAGDAGAAKLSYTPAGQVDASTHFDPIVITDPSGAKRDLGGDLQSGELKGLLDVRDTSAVAVNDQLNEYLRQFSAQINAAHNASSAYPPPASLTGKNTSLTAAEALTGFTGTTSLTTLSSNGNLTHNLQLAFNANGDGGGTMTLDGVAAGSFTAANFVSSVNTAFGGSATVAFSNGTLSLTASGAGGNSGVAVVDSTTSPSSRNGQGFSQVFGLNDLITSDVPTTTATGLTGTSNSGYAPGSHIGFSITSAGGSDLADLDFVVPTGVTTMSGLVSALNDTTNGLGKYGTFGLDASGTLKFTGFGNPANALGVTSDTTARNGTGASFSQFFGVGGSGGNLAGHLQVSTAISNNPDQMALGHVSLTTTGGVAALSPDDGAGGLSLSDIGTNSVTFAKTGLNSGGISNLERYASDLAGQVGNLAATAKTANDSNTTLLNEATSRRSSYEGVNLDEELVHLTTYQQGYSAAGRLIQAAKDMYDTLLQMV